MKLLTNLAFVLGALLPLTVVNSQVINSTAFVNKLFDSSDLGQMYAYAPCIIYEAGTFHMFYCSNGQPWGWDTVRYAWSTDGRLWSAPTIVLRVSDPVDERACCDPSVVYYNAGDGPYYYMFYSGNSFNVQTVMFVARSASVSGPYYKYTERNTWEINPPDPRVILSPQHSAPENSGFYGAGQSSVIVYRGQLNMWYYDDTSAYPQQSGRIYFSESSSPTLWSTGVDTGTGGNSVDVKLDPTTDILYMYDISNFHGATSTLRRRIGIIDTTIDVVGMPPVSWGAWNDVVPHTSFPDYAHNVGISGDRLGNVINGRALAVYGAPYDLASSVSWGAWDLYGHAINPAGAVWNDIPWGMEMPSIPVVVAYPDPLVVVGDYDGDGKADPALLNDYAGTLRWFIVSSATGQAGTATIPYGWWDSAVPTYNVAEPVLGDYDGDGKDDLCLLDRDDWNLTRQWYCRSSATLQPVSQIPLGTYWPGPVYSKFIGGQDFDGDGKTDRCGVDVGSWYIISSVYGQGGLPSTPWGWTWQGMTAANNLAVGDYDADGRADKAIIERFSDRTQWYVISSASGQAHYPWGWPLYGMASNPYIDELVLGDFDGDGRTNRGYVHRGSPNSTWHIVSENGTQGVPNIPWGWTWEGMDSTTKIAVGDYDGDGKTDRAIVGSLMSSRPRWYIITTRPFAIY